MSLPEAAPGRARILVAEDSRTQAERLRHMLQQHGFEVTVAPDGRAAMEALAELRPHLVVSDVNMPHIDGYQLTRRVKADPRWRETPVILVTTMSDPEDVIRGLECGADSFVLKPYDEQYMLGRVRYALANREARRIDDPAIGVGIFFNGQRHFITADRLQILNLLLSTYEAAIERNRELSRSKESLEQQSAEISLANRFLDEVIENIPHLLSVKDAQDLRYVRVNRALEALMGCSRDELVGRTDADIFPPEQAEAFAARDRELLAGRADSAPVEEPVRTRGGELRMLRTRRILIRDEFDQPRFVLGMSEDVTEAIEREREILRLNEALRQRTAEADAANRAKSTFLATMSHEIRTPMNGMLGLLELLSLTSLDEGQRATLETIRESSASLLRIVDDVLDFSKIEAGQLEIRPEPASIPRVLADVERTYASAAAAKGLALRSDAAPALAAAHWTDALRLRQVLGNFVSNAIKFTQSGSVHVAAEVAQEAPGEQRLRLHVRDTGPGIAPEHQQRLFQPFSQGDAHLARRAGGTGLGLSICRRLAELMGGSVRMDSTPGQGTTMTLELVLRTAEPSPDADHEPAFEDSLRSLLRPAPDPADAAAGGPLVLVVDDHPTNRMLLERQVNLLGYGARTAEDGEAALATWRSGRFGAVITDCEMPRMNGYELAGAIRRLEQEEGRARTPVIACTAHALSGEAQKCLAAGMDDCLVKPIGLLQLRRKLEQWLPLALPLRPAAAEPVPAGAPADDAVLDLALIEQTWGGAPETVRDILGFFRHTNDADAERLVSAVAAGDLAQAALAAHRMLGSSRMVGAQCFSRVCERLHGAARAGDPGAVHQQMDAFHAEWQRLDAWIDRQLERLAPERA